MALLIMGVAIVAILAAVLTWDGMDVRRQEREAQKSAGGQDEPKRLDEGRRL